jgi:phospholipid/cholesterol/gamma-HCH transport system substrate-binding protein
MTERTRNLIVGSTVLGAMGLLIVMVVMFTRLPGGLQGGYELDIIVEDTGGVNVGDSVYLRGLRVGYIDRIRFIDKNHPTTGIQMTARVDHGVPIDDDTICYISPSVMGPAMLNLRTGEPRDLRGLMELPEGTIHGMIEKTGPLAELKAALTDIAAITDSLLQIIGPADQTDVAIEQSGVRGAIIRLNRTLDEFHAFAAEARESVGTITETTETASGHVEDLAKSLVDSADELSLVLSSMQRIAAKIESGEGTAGKLVNDPRLYRELLDTAEQTSQLMQEIRLLVEQWQAEGIEMKLK